MSWNYRVVRKTNKNTGETHFGMHEVYYDDSGRPRTVSVEPQAVLGETPDEISWVLERMREAYAKPILDFDEIGADDPED